MSRKNSPVSVTQALLYMKLRDCQYPKTEALKHSSAQRFKTDSGLKSGLYTFHGLSLRVPVTDPEKRFTPYVAFQDTGDYERLGRAYDQFLRKYRVESGELEARKNSEMQLKLTDFQEKPKAPWMLSREKHPSKVRKSPASLLVQTPVALPTPLLSHSSSFSEGEDLFPPASLPASPPPPRTAAPSPATLAPDHISRVVSFSGGSLLFRALSPSLLKKTEKPLVPVRRSQARKSTMEFSSGFARVSRRASTFIGRSTRLDL
jgi:hypothetical protein